MKNSNLTNKSEYKDWVKNAVPQRYLLRYADAAIFLGVSQTVMERLAKEADAVYHYGKVCWVNILKVMAYLECCNGNIWEE